MATDGEIDFTTYTREELEDALHGMDHTHFPINSGNLKQELDRRKALQAAAEAAAKESGAPVLDRMVSAPSAFEVMFEPAATFLNWWGPSRNDFHLIGVGTVHVDDTLVRVTGRRFAYLIGIPMIDNNELGRRYVLNVEVLGNAVRFELRVPNEKICGVTLWLKSVAEAEKLCKLLPTERSADFVPQLAQHLAFERALVAQSPKTPVTYALAGLCTFLYVGTALGTYQPFTLSGRSLVALGSDFGPYTLSGEWWRLFTCLFLHAGLVHLAFNMWALLSFGRMAERLFGSLSFAVIYLAAGLAGSLASVSVNPAVNSVGASGAIFGILGALIAMQVRNDGSIPAHLLRPLRTSFLVFTGYGLLSGFLSATVDNAAHLGGLMAGFLLGLALTRPVTGLPLPASALLHRLGAAILVAGLLLATGVSTAKLGFQRLSGEGLFNATMLWFAPREKAALHRWREIVKLADADQLDDATYAKDVEEEVLPFWREAEVRWARIHVTVASDAYENLQLLNTVSRQRVEAYTFLAQGLRKNDDQMISDALAKSEQIDAQLAKRTKAE